MSRTQVKLSEGGTTSYVKAKDLKAGTTISGIFRGTFEDKFEKLNHRLEQADGSTIVINGTTQLNNLIAKVSEGTKLDVVYKGKSTIKSGKYAGKEAHSFDVFTVGDAGKPAAAVKSSKASEFPF